MAYSSSTAHFNPRSPHGERLPILAKGEKQTYISTHAPRTGSDGVHRRIRGDVAISTHAPRTGSDDAAAVADGKDKPFQPTLPARGATAVKAKFREAS